MSPSSPLASGSTPSAAKPSSATPEAAKPASSPSVAESYSLYQNLSRDTADIAKSLGFAATPTVRNI